MRQTVGGRRLIRHPHCQHVFRTERSRGEVRRDGRVHAAGEAGDGFREAAARHLVADELHQPSLHQRSVDVEWRRCAGDHDGCRGGRRRRCCVLGDHERLRCIVRSVIGQHERRAVHRRVDVAREVRPGMRHVAQQRRVGTGPHEIVQVAGDGGHRGFEQGQRVSHVAMRTHDRRCTAEHLAAFTANEVAERHEHAMLLGDVADESLPSIHAGRHSHRHAATGHGPVPPTTRTPLRRRPARRSCR